MVRSERLAAAAAILRMSGLLLDFMISGRENVAMRIVFNGHKKTDYREFTSGLHRRGEKTLV